MVQGKVIVAAGRTVSAISVAVCVVAGGVSDIIGPWKETRHTGFSINSACKCASDSGVEDRLRLSDRVGIGLSYTEVLKTVANLNRGVGVDCRQCNIVGLCYNIDIQRGAKSL